MPEPTNGPPFLPQALSQQNDKVAYSAEGHAAQVGKVAPAPVDDRAEKGALGKEQREMKNAPERKPTDWNAVMGMAAILGLVVVCYQSYLGRESNRLARDAFNESVRSTRVRERPWVVFDSIEVRGLENVRGAEASVGAVVKNVGDLPAQGFKSRVSAIWVGTDQRFPESPDDIVRAGKTEADIERYASASVLGPGQTTRIWAGTAAPVILADVVGRKARHLQRLHVYGHLEYSGPGMKAETYRTRFCVTIEPGGDYRTCPQYNAID